MAKSNKFNHLNGFSRICDLVRNKALVIKGVCIGMEKDLEHIKSHEGKRELAVQISMTWLGTPYVWGGNDPIKGFDCSGMVIEVLKSVGILPRRGDWTAQDLWDKFSNLKVETPRQGCLVFWQAVTGKVRHVEMCIDNDLSIGASGGGSGVKTLQDAIEKDAYIKIRPFRTHKNIKGFLDPFGEVK